MNLSEKGLVLKVVNYRESDRRITVLTKNGLLAAYAKAARNLKSKKFAATAPFCYSDFVFFEAREGYIVNEASIIEVFYELRNDVERIAVAQYFCELLIAVTPESVDCSDFLRLILNSLHYLCDENKSIDLIKSVFELKLMCFAGFMPNLVACDECAEYSDSEMLFDMENAVIYCSSCLHKAPPGSLPLNASMLSVMRHIAFSDFDKLFSFTASKENLRAVSQICEKYVSLKAEQHFKALDYYYSVKV